MMDQNKGYKAYSSSRRHRKCGKMSFIKPHERRADMMSTNR